MAKLRVAFRDAAEQLPVVGFLIMFASSIGFNNLQINYFHAFLSTTRIWERNKPFWDSLQVQESDWDKVVEEELDHEVVQDLKKAIGGNPCYLNTWN